MMKIKTQNKLILLNAIRERKSVLFGNFKSTSNDEKVESWKSVHNIAQSLQLATSDRSWQFTRDKLYGLWKCRTLEKRDNKKGKFTGKAGGKKCQYDDVDLAILDILDEDSAIVQGLGLPGSSTFAENNTSIVKDNSLLLDTNMIPSVDVHRYTEAKATT
ncbi:uncharacterized protein LOC126553502 [Aphis gossypii]|uniref:uncharacterized protein LOC126553502 n=1 Tax=Aphis gossypii TaxID=80765 RepID=UPI002158BA42|nr:uncharacterized protein LOC126553502 [Aphis gossypii]